MNRLLLLSLFMFSGCALWEEIVSRPADVRKTHDQSQPKVSSLKIVDEKKFKSENNQGTLSVITLNSGVKFLSLYHDKDTVSYKKGHSVDVKIGDEIFVAEVQETSDPEIVRFAEPSVIISRMSGKEIEVELILNDKTKKKYLFHVRKDI